MVAGVDTKPEGSDGSATESTSSEEADLDDLIAQLGMEDVLEEEIAPAVTRHGTLHEELGRVDANPELDPEIWQKV